MNRGYIISKYKKKRDKSNILITEEINTTNSLMKILCKISRNRIKREFKISKEQCGFTAGKSSTDNLLTIRQFFEKYHGKGGRVIFGFY